MTARGYVETRAFEGAFPLPAHDSLGNQSLCTCHRPASGLGSRANLGSKVENFPHGVGECITAKCNTNRKCNKL